MTAVASFKPAPKMPIYVKPRSKSHFPMALAALPGGASVLASDLQRAGFIEGMPGVGQSRAPASPESDPVAAPAPLTSLSSVLRTAFVEANNPPPALASGPGASSGSAGTGSAAASTFVPVPDALLTRSLAEGGTFQFAKGLPSLASGAATKDAARVYAVVTLLANGASYFNYARASVTFEFHLQGDASAVLVPLLLPPTAQPLVGNPLKLSVPILRPSVNTQPRGSGGEISTSEPIDVSGSGPQSISKSIAATSDVYASTAMLVAPALAAAFHVNISGPLAATIIAGIVYAWGIDDVLLHSLRHRSLFVEDVASRGFRGMLIERACIVYAACATGVLPSGTLPATPGGGSPDYAELTKRLHALAGTSVSGQAMAASGDSFTAAQSDSCSAFSSLPPTFTADLINALNGDVTGAPLLAAAGCSGRLEEVDVLFIMDAPSLRPDEPIDTVVKTQLAEAKAAAAKELVPATPQVKVILPVSAHEESAREDVEQLLSQNKYMGWGMRGAEPPICVHAFGSRSSLAVQLLGSGLGLLTLGQREQLVAYLRSGHVRSVFVARRTPCSGAKVSPAPSSSSPGAEAAVKNGDACGARRCAPGEVRDAFAREVLKKHGATVGLSDTETAFMQGCVCTMPSCSDCAPRDTCHARVYSRGCVLLRAAYGALGVPAPEAIGVLNDLLRSIDVARIESPEADSEQGALCVLQHALSVPARSICSRSLQQTYELFTDSEGSGQVTMAPATSSCHPSVGALHALPPLPGEAEAFALLTYAIVAHSSGFDTLLPLIHAHGKNELSALASCYTVEDQPLPGGALVPPPPAPVTRMLAELSTSGPLAGVSGGEVLTRLSEPPAGGQAVPRYKYLAGLVACRDTFAATRGRAQLQQLTGAAPHRTRVALASDFESVALGAIKPPPKAGSAGAGSGTGATGVSSLYSTDKQAFIFVPRRVGWSHPSTTLFSASMHAAGMGPSQFETFLAVFFQLCVRSAAGSGSNSLLWVPWTEWVPQLPVLSRACGLSSELLPNGPARVLDINDQDSKTFLPEGSLFRDDYEYFAEAAARLINFSGLLCPQPLTDSQGSPFQGDVVSARRPKDRANNIQSIAAVRLSSAAGAAETIVQEASNFFAWGPGGPGKLGAARESPSEAANALEQLEYLEGAAGERNRSDSLLYTARLSRIRASSSVLFYDATLKRYPITPITFLARTGDGGQSSFSVELPAHEDVRSVLNQGIAKIGVDVSYHQLTCTSGDGVALTAEVELPATERCYRRFRLTATIDTINGAHADSYCLRFGSQLTGMLESLNGGVSKLLLVQAQDFSTLCIPRPSAEKPTSDVPPPANTVGVFARSIHLRDAFQQVLCRMYQVVCDGLLPLDRLCTFPSLAREIEVIVLRRNRMLLQSEPFERLRRDLRTGLCLDLPTVLDALLVDCAAEGGCGYLPLRSLLTLPSSDRGGIVRLLADEACRLRISESATSPAAGFMRTLVELTERKRKSALRA